MARKKESESVSSLLERVLGAGGFEKALRGGVSNVLIKPNLLVPKLPSTGATTHVELVEELVKICLEGGARQITIAESSNWGIDTDHVFQKLGYGDMAKRKGCRLLNFKKDQLVDVSIKGRYIEQVKLPRALLDADLVVNFPVLKVHRMTHVTLGMKNVAVGSMTDDQKEKVIHAIGRPFILPDEMVQEGSGLDWAILELNLVLPVGFTVIDGLVGQEGPGAPLTGQPVGAGVLVAGDNLVAVDTVGSKLMGVDPRKVAYLVMAEKAGLGPVDLDKIEIKGDDMKETRRLFAPAIPSCFDDRLPDGVEIHNHGGCYACRSVLNYFVRRHAPELKNLGKVTFYTGKPPREKIGSERRHLVFVGNCTLASLYGGGFVPGCPPRSRRQLFQALGAVDLYTADEEAETRW
jgi:uncharacterized protein (DUF362 family)